MRCPSRRCRAPLVGLAATLVLTALPHLASAACPTAPRAACRAGGQTKLKLANVADDGHDKLAWNWSRGEATTQADFGNPVATTAYSLCVWGPSGLVLSLDLPPGGACDGKPCWTAQAATGWRYRDPKRTTAGIQSMRLAGSTRARAKIAIVARGPALPDPTLPLALPATVQLLQSDGNVCFEGTYGPATARKNTATDVLAKTLVGSPVPPLPSAACGQALTTYVPGTSTVDSVVHGGLTRTFRVYVPTSYAPGTPMPVFLLFHGGFGTGAQVEGNARIVEVAEAQGFIAVSPDGVPSPGNIRTWNGGGCCGYAVTANVDDVGFVGALLDRLESIACLDRRRVYASGMSNGGILSHRLGCDLAERIRAIGPVSGTDMTSSCVPSRAVPIMEIHGTADTNVPYGGGLGCGLAGVPFTSVPETIARWRSRDGCRGMAVVVGQQGDTTCRRQGKCPNLADVILCDVTDGGHTWPGGNPPAVPGLGNCLFGNQSQTFSASNELWTFFAQHPPR